MTIAEALGSARGGRHREMVTNLQNGVSPGTAGVLASKDALHKGTPFIREGLQDITTIVHVPEFITKVVRRFTGREDGSRFSKEEQEHYDMYINYMDGGEVADRDLPAIKALDEWMSAEIRGEEHPEITRDFDKSTHPWRKLDLTGKVYG